MYDALNNYTDRILAEYNKTNDEALALALTFFYSEVLQDPKFESQRTYCKNRMLEYKGKDLFLDGFCEAFFQS